MDLWERNKTGKYTCGNERRAERGRIQKDREGGERTRQRRGKWVSDVTHKSRGTKIETNTEGSNEVSKMCSKKCEWKRQRKWRGQCRQ